MAVERDGERVPAVEDVVDEAGQLGGGADLDEGAYAVGVHLLDRFTEAHAAAPLSDHELAYLIRRRRHRCGSGARIKRCRRRLEIEIPIHGIEIGVRREQRRVIGPAERQKRAQAALTAELPRQRLQIRARAVQHHLLLAIVERDVDVGRLGQRDHPLARHGANGQQRAAEQFARLLHGVIEPFDVVQPDFEVVPVGPA